MKIIALMVAILTAVAFIGGNVMATPPGKNVEYAGGALGKVIFDGKKHADAGLKCAACHVGLFQMRREAKITMADHKTDKYCFACHSDGKKTFNGKVAFASTNCAGCHKK
jgi:thiosulfate reductase cytochrome b subunit